MRKRWMSLALLIGGFTLVFAPSVQAMSDQEILQELKALKDRIDLDFAPTNKTVFGPDEGVALDLYVKNVKKWKRPKQNLQTFQIG